MHNLMPRKATTTLAGASEEKLVNLNRQEDRLRLTITNNTGADLRVRKGRGAAAGVGILLLANEVLIDEPLIIGTRVYMYQGEWYAYSAAGGDVDIDEETATL